MSLRSRKARMRRRVARGAGLAFTVVVVSALSSFGAAPAHADPGVCIDHVMENGYEATDTVLKACKIAKTGQLDDIRTCRRMLAGEGVDRDVAKRACWIASRPEEETSA
ncbi:hypothetical protein AB0425_30055 [Actinosynnema sp. NPDC051121]